jgi:hypothetical protein
MQEDTAKEALKLYQDLRSIDGKLRAMNRRPPYADTPLQKVVFYMCEGGFSGPMDYVPTLNATGISALIVDDMQAARCEVVHKLERLGFTAPPLQLLQSD